MDTNNAPSTPAPDALYAIHTAITDEVCALRCAYTVIDQAEDEHGGDEELSAARSLLGHTISRLAALANRLDAVDVRHLLVPKGDEAEKSWREILDASDAISNAMADMPSSVTSQEAPELHRVHALLSEARAIIVPVAEREGARYVEPSEGAE